VGAVPPPLTEVHVPPTPTLKTAAEPAWIEASKSAKKRAIESTMPHLFQRLWLFLYLLGAIRWHVDFSGPGITIKQVKTHSLLSPKKSLVRDFLI
jgi:hypothetical protein